ncbi:saccharopine dehydrogenase NADP-binding domain-containing protein [Paenibacillus marinisediminis]
MNKIMVVGASGVLGKLVCVELLRIFDNQIKLVVTDYKAERGKNLASSFAQEVEYQHLDVRDEESVKQAVKDIDIVVVVLKQEFPHIQRICIDLKILCVDVTPFYDFVEKVNHLNQNAENNEAGSVVMSGYFPGLSGLMVKKAISNFQEVTEVNVGLLQNTNANVGVSGILDMLTLISQQVIFDNKVISGFTKKRKMHFVNHHEDKEVRLIDHPEKILLKNKLRTNQLNYWTAWNVNAFNKQISLLRRIGFFNIIHKINNQFLSKVVKHNPDQHEDTLLTVEVKGIIDNKEKIKIISLSTFSDYHTTAMVTASIAKIAQQKHVKGVVSPFEITNLDEVLSQINCPRIVLEEVEK